MVDRLLERNMHEVLLNNDQLNIAIKEGSVFQVRGEDDGGERRRRRRRRGGGEEGGDNNDNNNSN